MTKKTDTKNEGAPPEDKPKNDEMDTNETKDKEEKKDNTSAEVVNGQGNTAELEESQSSNKSDD